MPKTVSPPCLETAIVRTLAVPPPFSLEHRDIRLSAPIDGFGVDQAFPSSDLVLISDGTELVTFLAGSRYGHVGRVLLISAGVSPCADQFTVRFHELVTEALAP